MANRIDAGVHPTAHTAVQVMIVRAQQVADQTGKAVGVRYDLTSDEVSLIEITPDVPKDVSFVRIAAPAGEESAAEQTAASAVDGCDVPSRGLKAADIA